MALLILVWGSAATGSMIWSAMENALVMARAMSRHPLDEMSMDGRYQVRGRSTSPVVNKHIVNTRKWFKVCPKCQRPLRGGLTQLAWKKANDLFMITKRSHVTMTTAMSRQGPQEKRHVRKTVIKQAVLQAL